MMLIAACARHMRRRLRAQMRRVKECQRVIRRVPRVMLSAQKRCAGAAVWRDGSKRGVR